MKILILTPYFLPSIGGLEVQTDVLARSLQLAAGWEVCVVTLTPDDGSMTTYPYSVIREPSISHLLRLVKDASIVLHNSLSLKWIWTSLIWRHKTAVVHHMSLEGNGARRSVTRLIKRSISRRLPSIAVSRYLKYYYGGYGEVIYNPLTIPINLGAATRERKRDVIFVGRLIPEKGVDILVAALGILKSTGRTLTVTIVGNGPALADLVHQAELLGVRDDIVFAGLKRGEALVREYHAHRVAVVPSVWQEPFGLVALESLACGCNVVVSRVGGLPDAVGRCASLVEPENPQLLSNAIEICLVSDRKNEMIVEHLSHFSPDKIAQSYIDFFKMHIKKH